MWCFSWVLAASFQIFIFAKGPSAIAAPIAKSDNKTLSASSNAIKPPAQPQKTKSPCADDVDKHCPEINVKNRPLIRSCLAKHFEKISSACVEYSKKNNPCYDDSVKFCNDKNPFGNNVDCLVAKTEQLSPKCKALYGSVRGFDTACDSDLKKICPNAKDRTAVNNCMLPALAKLSNKCKGFLESTPCVQDWKKLCLTSKELPSACMDQNESKLSQACTQSRLGRLGKRKKSP